MVFMNFVVFGIYPVFILDTKIPPPLIGMGFRLRKALSRSLLCWFYANVKRAWILYVCLDWYTMVPWNKTRDWSLGIRIGLFCT